MRSEQLLPMGKVAQIIMGQSPHGDSYNNTGHGFPLLNGPTEFGPTHPQPCTWTSTPTRFCQKGDLLFCVRGSTTGRMNWADKTYCIGRGLCAIRGRENATDTNFLYYTLRNDLPRLLALCAGSVFPNLSRSDFDGFLITWPSEEKRDAIVSLLKTLDDKIELNRRMNETLEAMARAIFKSWFVDFDPVKAKAEGKTLKGLSREIANLFPDSFTDSDLGPIPVGWCIKRLPEAIEVNPRRTLRRGEMAFYLDMKNMPTTSARATGICGREFGSGTKFMNGDVLMARITPCLENGKTAYVDFLGDRKIGWGSTEYIVLRSRSPLPVEYAYFLSRSDQFREHAIQNMTGTSGRQRVPASCFDQYEFVVPSEPVATAFGVFAKAVMTKMKASDEESSTLASIRDALLPKLLSGEIHINDAEKFAV